VATSLSRAIGSRAILLGDATLNIDSYEPDRQLAWVAHRTDDLFAIGPILRAMLVWPFVPFWLLWTVALGLKGSLNVQRPFWLRRVAWDGRGQRLVIRYGLWPLLFTGRKAVSFHLIERVVFDLEPSGEGDDEAVTATCTVTYGADRTLTWTQRFAGLQDGADAEDLVFRVARVLKRKTFTSRSGDGGARTIELFPSSDAAPDGEGEAERVPSRKRSVAELTARRAEREPLPDKRRPRKPGGQQAKRLRRLLSCRVLHWRAGKLITLRKSWDLMALFMAAAIAIPLLLVPAGFVALALGAFVLLPMMGVERLFDLVIPKDYALYLGGIAIGAGLITYLFHGALGFLREYGARRVQFDWSARLVTLKALTQRVDLAFEDVDAVLVRGPWDDDELPEGMPHWDTRDAIELQRRGSRAPLRLFEVSHTNGFFRLGHRSEQTEEEQQEELRKLATQIAGALGVPMRAVTYGTVVESD